MEDVSKEKWKSTHSFCTNCGKIHRYKPRRIGRNTPTQAAAPAKSGGGLLSRLVRGPTVTPLDKLLKTRTELEGGIYGQAQWYVRHQQDFGRKRWPLLVAARGWGDPNVTQGKYVRPPQGTMELGFPVYSGTWYGRTPLGYFDYFADGGMAGGGMRMGAECAHGTWGNCVAAPVFGNGFGESGGGA